MGSVVWVVLLQALFILIIRPAGATDLLRSENKSSLCSRTDPSMDPFYEVRYGQDVVWQIPPNPKAVLFLAHGSGKEPLSYFDSAPNCRKCYGFPEDRAAILEALRRKYAVLMVKSLGEYWHPWGVDWPVPPSPDRMIVTSVIREWSREHSLEHLPLVAFGYSSGGNFSTLLTLDLDIKSLILMCSPGELELVKHATPSSFPPTLFIAMPKDGGPLGFHTTALVAGGILRSNGVMTKQIDVLAKPVHSFVFAEKIPCVQRTTSEKIYAAYKVEGWLDENDYVTHSPLLHDWEAVLWKHKILNFCHLSNDICLAKHIQQELNVAYAFHSFTSEKNEEIFNWLDGTAFVDSSDSAGLLASG